jgi:hypothetical protein
LLLTAPPQPLDGQVPVAAHQPRLCLHPVWICARDALHRTELAGARAGRGGRARTGGRAHWAGAGADWRAGLMSARRRVRSDSVKDEQGVERKCYAILAVATDSPPKEFVETSKVRGGHAVWQRRAQLARRPCG